MVWLKLLQGDLKSCHSVGTQMLGACVQPSSSLSNIVHVATANKAKYAVSEACVSEIINFIMKIIPMEENNL